MSFLARLAQRARASATSTVHLMPKGLASRHTAPVRREETAEEEDEAAPLRLRRAEAVRRQETPPPEEEPVARAAGPQAAAEEEREMQPLRRAAAAGPGVTAEEDDVQAVRRAAPEEMPPQEEDQVQPARTIRRAEEVPLDDGERPLRQPFQADLAPDAAPPHADLASEEEPSDLQALRREQMPLTPPATGPLWQGEAPAARPFTEVPARFDPWREPWRTPAEPVPFLPDATRADHEPWSAAAGRERPQVIIDQIDVLIHEPSPAAAQARSVPDHGRMLRARYLRRL